MDGRFEDSKQGLIDMDRIRINQQSIRAELGRYKKDIPAAISEYVWNAFDSNANVVEIECSFRDDSSMGYPILTVIDDGDGWDMSNRHTVEMFLDSQKRLQKAKYRSLPHGSRGVGRFSFAAFSSKASWTSVVGDRKYSLSIKSETLDEYSLDVSDVIDGDRPGTRVEFLVNNEEVNDTFINTVLNEELPKRFAWFLELYPLKQIVINGAPLDIRGMIIDEKEMDIFVDGEKLSLKLVQWKRQFLDKESSKVYFLDSGGEEQFKVSTGFNNKSDVFYHSAYVKSNRFKGYVPEEEDDSENQPTLFDNKEQRRFVKNVKEEVREELRKFRTPYIEKISHDFVDQLSKDHFMPRPEDYTVSEKDFRELIRQTYVIAPEMYVSLSDNNKRMVLRLMASLMASNERNLLIKIIEGVYSLSDEQKDKLSQLLDRTSLGNVVDTVTEIDHRLQVLFDLEDIIYDKGKSSTTLEVKHLQKILDNNFWVFGDQYRLVSTTEGKIKDVIERLAKEDLGIMEYETEVDSMKELDLCLSKQIITPQPNGIARIHNVVIELKRPSVKIGIKELGQITTYKDHILEDPLCSGPNMSWDFILVGADICSDDICEQIESAASHGEKNMGLIRKVTSHDKQYSMYVRKWSDIINCEHRPKLEFLRAKLQTKPKDNTNKTQDEIVENLTKKR